MQVIGAYGDFGYGDSDTVASSNLTINVDVDAINLTALAVSIASDLSISVDVDAINLSAPAVSIQRHCSVLGAYGDFCYGDDDVVVVTPTTVSVDVNVDSVTLSPPLINDVVVLLINKTHTDDDYAKSLLKLLPLGAAWDWQDDGFGFALVKATCKELVRVEQAALNVLVDAKLLHQHGGLTYMLTDYQAVALAATRLINRRPAGIGSRIGDRLWRHSAEPPLDSVVVIVNDDVIPSSINSHIGSRLWSPRSRYYLTLKFDKSFVDRNYLYAALREFKQAHVCLYVIDTPILEA